MIRRLREIFVSWRPDFVILILGLMSLTMGIWLIHPTETFGTAVTYSVLEETAAEWFWGSLMILPGVLKIYGTFTEKWSTAKVGCWIGFFVWMFFAISFYQGNPSSPVGSILFWKSILNGWLILHIDDARGGVDLN